MQDSKQIRKYLHNIKRLLPATANVRNKIVDMIRNALLAKSLEAPEKDISEIIKDFGSPEEVAASYIEEMGTAEILKGFGKKNRILTIITVGVIGVFILIALALTIALIDAHNIAEKSQNAHIEITTKTIDEHQLD